MKITHKIILILFLTFGGLFAIFGQSLVVCHGCYESKWRYQTATVRCEDAPTLVENFQTLGFETEIKIYYSQKEQICDILAKRWLNLE